MWLARQGARGGQSSDFLPDETHAGASRFPRKSARHYRPRNKRCQFLESSCRCKMRMSGLSKVEMSAFIGGRGPHGNGANRLEPTRTGQIARATRGQAEADHAGRSRQAAEDQRSPYPSAAVASGGTRRPSSDPWITRTKIKPQVSRAVGAEDFAPGAATLCGLRTHPGRRALD